MRKEEVQKSDGSRVVSWLSHRSPSLCFFSMAGISCRDRTNIVSVTIPSLFESFEPRCRNASSLYLVKASELCLHLHAPFAHHGIE